MEKKEETFLLVSLDEDKAKQLAQVISNDTCRKVLDHLAKKKATETELASELNMPLSTVHYNLKHLVANRLVEAEEFHYSEKGREVLHYSLSNKYVIIAPKGISESIKDRLRSIIGAVLSVGFIALAVQYVPKFFNAFGVSKATVSMSETQTLQTSVREMASAPAESFAQAAAQAPTSAPVMAPSAAASQPVWIWVVVGAVSCIILYLLFEYIRKRRQK